MSLHSAMGYKASCLWGTLWISLCGAGKLTDGKQLLWSLHHNVTTLYNFYGHYTTMLPQYITSMVTKILEVNLFAIAYRLFHEDFSPQGGVLYKSSPSSTLPLVIPEYTWIVLTSMVITLSYTFLAIFYIISRFWKKGPQNLILLFQPPI